MKKIKTNKYIITIIACCLVLLVTLGVNAMLKNNGTSSKPNKTDSKTETAAVLSEDKPESNEKSGTTSSNKGEVTASDYRVEDYSAQMYATIDSLNIRSEPSEKSTIIGTLKKNITVTVTGKTSNGWYRVNQGDKVGYCFGNYLAKAPAKTASSAAATAAVPNSLPYRITVNRTQNIVIVYSKDESGQYTVPFKAMVCSVGESGKTPTGTYNTSSKYTWGYLSGNVYGQYCTRITGPYLFHSVPYFSRNKGDLEYDEYNKLGEAASLGCVRLSVADAKWIFDNCPAGTTVTIYDSSEPEPLARPEPTKIDTTDSRKGWDPTDPDPDNPWKS